MKIGTKITVIGVVLIVFLLAFPFNVTVAPEWRVKVVDENGHPLAGVYVSEFATHGTLDFQHNEAECTHLDGEARFIHHTVRASVLTRLSRWRFNIHSFPGPYVAVGVERLGYGDMPTQVPMPNFNGLVWYGSPSQMNSQVTLHKCPEGFTGFKCSFDYDYFFAVNSSARQMAACQSMR